jgi:hypothetical protein
MNGLLLISGQSDLFGQAFVREPAIFKPRVLGLEARVPVNFIFDRFVDSEDITLLPKDYSQNWSDTFSQPEVGIRVEQYKY